MIAQRGVTMIAAIRISTERQRMTVQGIVLTRRISKGILVSSICLSLTLGLLPSLISAESESASGECEGSLGELVWSIGFAPDRCVTLPPDGRMCSWSLLLHSEDPPDSLRKFASALLRLHNHPVRSAFANALDPRVGVNVVASATSSGVLGGCYVGLQNAEMKIYPEPKSPKTSKDKRTTKEMKEHRERVERGRQTAIQAAREGLSVAKTVFEVSEWVGEAPEECLGAPEPEIVCSWIAARRSPGYIQVARAAAVESGILTGEPKIQVLCRFPGPNAPRGSDSCLLTFAH